MKLSVTTLGCPQWTLDELCRHARDYGLDGVDFRGLGPDLDITVTPAFTRDLDATAARIHDAGLEVSAVSSSLFVCDPRKRKANLEEARRTIPVARGLGAGNIRIFGGGDPATHSRDELVQAGLDCLAEILDLDGAGDLNWLFETHDHWIASEHCRRLLDSIPSPAFGVLWDMGHTPRVTDESPAQTLAAIGQRIGYTHVKDALYAPDHPESMADGWRYVLPGTGQLPLQEAIQGLRDLGYDGWLTFEHEKRWHPELAEPEEAFPAFVRWAREAVDRTL